MEFVTAAFRNDAHHTAATATELRIVRIANDLHLLDRIDCGRNEQAIPAIAGASIDPIDHDSRSRAAPAIHTKTILILIRS